FSTLYYSIVQQVVQRGRKWGQRSKIITDHRMGTLSLTSPKDENVDRGGEGGGEISMRSSINEEPAYSHLVVSEKSEIGIGEVRVGLAESNEWLDILIFIDTSLLDIEEWDLLHSGSCILPESNVVLYGLC
ncbi:hypothetical protein PENTCL1PPCAC_18129, partial [Pristionchus entomophagus]